MAALAFAYDRDLDRFWHFRRVLGWQSVPPFLTKVDEGCRGSRELLISLTDELATGNQAATSTLKMLRHRLAELQSDIETVDKMCRQIANDFARRSLNPRTLFLAYMLTKHMRDEGAIRKEFRHGEG